MERNSQGSTGMDHLRGSGQNFYESMEPRMERLIHANQKLFLNPSTTTGSGIRPPEVNLAPVLPPVLQYSTTGEEFDFDFMRERVNSWQQFIPTSSVCPRAVVGYADPRVESDIGLAIPVAPSVKLNHEKELDQKHSVSNLETGSYQDVQPLPQISSKNDNNRKVRNYVSWVSSDRPSTKMKFLCSFAGKVLPRPSDGKLRYVGGQTRIIQISKSILWHELVQKALSIYDETRLIKYQLPGEDLDALVSVSCDEDLQNMMEECCSIDDSGSHKPRMFLLSPSDIENNQFNLVNLEGNSDFYYLIAVNGMDLAPPKNVVVSKSNSENALDELFSLKVDKGPLEDPSRSVEARNMPLEVTEPVINMDLSLSIPPLSCSYESNSVHSDPPMTRRQTERRDTSPVSVPSQTSDFHCGGQSTEKISIPAFAKPTNQLQVSEKPHGGSHLQDLEASEEEAIMKKRFCEQMVNDAEQIQLMKTETPSLEERSSGENSSSKNSESERLLALDNDFGTALQEQFSPDSKVGVGAPSVHVKIQDCAQVPEPSEVSTEGAGHNTYELDTSHSSGDSNPNHTDASFNFVESSVLPKRVFHSEWIPKEQAETSRLSKSDDSFGTQFLMAHLHPEIRNPGTEFSDYACNENIFPKAGYPISATGSLLVKPQNVEHGTTQIGTNKEWVDDTCMVDSINNVDGHDSKCQKEESKCEIPVSNDEMDSLKCKNKENSQVGVSLLTNTTSKKNIPDLETKCPWDEETGFSGKIQNERQLDQLPSANETENTTVKGSSIGVEASAQDGILIDINDRFPQDFLAGISSVVKNSLGLPGLGPLGTDGAVLSVNMENHEPSRWSYFRDLVQNDVVQNDVSLMDDNHVGFLSPYSVNGEAFLDYRYPPLKTDSSLECDSHLSSDKVDRDESGFDGASNLNAPSNFDMSEVPSNLDTSEVEDKDGLQYDAKHAEETKCEDSAGFGGTQNAAAPFGLSLRDFDISTLQIIKNEDLEELKELGSGTFGTVYHGKWRGTDVAIKRIKKSCFIGRSSEQERLTFEFWREAAILSKLHHPNVVAFYGVVQDGPGGTLATVTEYMVNGSLRHVLQLKDRHLDYRKRLLIATDAAFGMEYLHSRKIIHFDLKCDNLLVNLRDPLRPICKVGDFGLSKIRRNTLVTGGVRGTLPWMAPELLNGSSTKVSEKVDVFSFGIVLWEILTGEEPYANMHYGAIIGGIVHNTLRPPVPSTCDPEWRTLMEQCWAPDAIARPAFKEIAQRLRAMSAQLKPPSHNQPAR